MHLTHVAALAGMTLFAIGCLRGAATPPFPVRWALGGEVMLSGEAVSARALTARAPVTCRVDSVTSSFEVQLVPGDVEVRGAPTPGLHSVTVAMTKSTPGFTVSIVRGPSLSSGAVLALTWSVEVLVADGSGAPKERFLLVARPDGTCGSAPLRPG